MLRLHENDNTAELAQPYHQQEEGQETHVRE